MSKKERGLKPMDYIKARGAEALFNECENMRSIRRHLERECPEASRSSIQYAMQNIKKLLAMKVRKSKKTRVNIINNIIEANFERRK